MRRVTYIATGEITSLKHEVGDHTMELGALVSEPFLSSAKGAEVLGRFRGDVIVEDEVDSASLFCSRKFSILFLVCAGWQREGQREDFASGFDSFGFGQRKKRMMQRWMI